MFSVLKFKDMQENYDENCALTYFLLIPDIFLLARTTYKEYNQAVNKGEDYINIWNLIDLSSFALSWTVTLCILVRYEIPDFRVLRIMACFSSLLLLVKLYDWMRIFDVTAFYIQLLKSTIKDMSTFMSILMYGLLIAGFPMMFIVMNWDKSDDRNIISAFLGSLWNLYLIMIGEFGFDDWEKEEDSVELIIMMGLFAAATTFSVIVQLTCLLRL